MCNLESHWFVLRRLYGQWLDLNSLHKRPKVRVCRVVALQYHIPLFCELRLLMFKMLLVCEHVLVIAMNRQHTVVCIACV